MFCYEKLINFQLECANEEWSRSFPESVGSAASYRSIAYYRYFRLLPVLPRFVTLRASLERENEGEVKGKGKGEKTRRNSTSTWRQIAAI